MNGSRYGDSGRNRSCEGLQTTPPSVEHFYEEPRCSNAAVDSWLEDHFKPYAGSSFRHIKRNIVKIRMDECEKRDSISTHSSTGSPLLSDKPANKIKPGQCRGVTEMPFNTPTSAVPLESGSVVSRRLAMLENMSPKSVSTIDRSHSDAKRSPAFSRRNPVNRSISCSVTDRNDPSHNSNNSILSNNPSGVKPQSGMMKPVVPPKQTRNIITSSTAPSIPFTSVTAAPIQSAHSITTADRIRERPKVPPRQSMSFSSSKTATCERKLGRNLGFQDRDNIFEAQLPLSTDIYELKKRNRAISQSVSPTVQSPPALMPKQSRTLNSNHSLSAHSNWPDSSSFSNSTESQFNTHSQLNHTESVIMKDCYATLSSDKKYKYYATEGVSDEKGLAVRSALGAYVVEKIPASSKSSDQEQSEAWGDRKFIRAPAPTPIPRTAKPRVMSKNKAINPPPSYATVRRGDGVVGGGHHLVRHRSDEDILDLKAFHPSRRNSAEEIDAGVGQDCGNRTNVQPVCTNGRSYLRAQSDEDWVIIDKDGFPKLSINGKISSKVSAAQCSVIIYIFFSSYRRCARYCKFFYTWL